MADARTDPPAADPSAPPEALPVKLEKLRFYRSEIQHEFSLLANRVSSYITSQSFLVIGFVMSMGNTNPRWGSVFRLVFPLTLALLGLATSALVWPGIQGACSTIDLWREKQEALLASDPHMAEYHVERPSGPSRRGRTVDLIHVRSLLFAKWAPWVFAAAWSVFGVLAFTLSLRE